jgi:hypothetical protein
LLLVATQELKLNSRKKAQKTQKKNERKITCSTCAIAESDHLPDIGQLT